MFIKDKRILIKFQQLLDKKVRGLTTSPAAERCFYNVESKDYKVGVGNMQIILKTT